MEGINYLLLCLMLCPLSLLIGAGVFYLARLALLWLLSMRLGIHNENIASLIALFLAAVVAFVFFNSQFAPAFPGYYQPKRALSNADIVGTWVITDFTSEYLIEEGYTRAEPTLILYSSGEFSTKDFPDLLFYDRDFVLYSGNGSWSLVRDFNGAWQVKLLFTRIYPPWYPDPPLSGPTPCPGSSVPCDGGLQFTFDLWHREAPYYLTKNIGGELGPVITYQRLGDDHETP